MLNPKQKAVQAERQRRYKEKHPERVREYARQHMARRRAKDPDKERDYMRKWMYGIEPDMYAALLASQGGRCAICEQEMVRQNIDHDHDTGEIRGILCNGCNSGLGLLGDSLESLERAVRYLKENRAAAVFKAVSS